MDAVCNDGRASEENSRWHNSHSIVMALTEVLLPLILLTSVAQGQLGSREMRDVYGVYRYDSYDGKKLYVRCNSPTAYISDDCGNDFNLERNSGQGRKRGRERVYGRSSSSLGSYRIFGYLKLYPKSGRFYRGHDVVSGGRGEVCPFSNYDTHNDLVPYNDDYERRFYSDEEQYHYNRRRWRRDLRQQPKNTHETQDTYSYPDHQAVNYRYYNPIII